MFQIIKINANLIGENNFVIVTLRVIDSGKQFFLATVFQARRACNARFEFKNPPVFALQLVGISRDIRPRAYETHIPYKHIP